MKLVLSALIALNLAAAYAAPRNDAVVQIAPENDVAEIAGKAGKGDSRILDGFHNDGAFIRTCAGLECKMMTVGDAKGMDVMSFQSVEEVKGDASLTKALTPSLTTMSESLQNLNAQKQLLENLEASMRALTAASSKGASLAEAAKGQFAASMTKGISFSPAASKGADMAEMSKGFPAPPSKGMSAPSSKGNSMAMTMQLEASMCPMTMYELGKTQKLKAEAEQSLRASQAVSGQLMAEKQRLESFLAAEKALKEKAQAQADFNAKYAAEQKAQAEMFASALAKSEAEKAMLRDQKAATEMALAMTQKELAESRETVATLTDSLNTCNDEKDALTVAVEEQTARADAAEAELAETKSALEAETDARIECEETLSFTQARLAKSEEDLNKERVAREQTEEELMKTMTDLAACQRELRVTTEILTRTQDDLQAKTQALAREEAAREALEAKLASTVEQLRAVEQELRDTQRALEDEQNAHATTQRRLAETEEELAATEAARQALEEAKQKLEDELAETKSQLEVMTAERDQLQITLDATSAALMSCTEEKMQLESDLAQEKAMNEMLQQQLGEAMMMLKAEKEAREELSATIALVQEASKQVQKEVEKLQFENHMLQQQVEKLKSEQETALALAAGCPPTYEKFGSACYKYVREKTQWKMAQEQCMKDSGNLVSIDSTEEQLFLTNYLKRHGASDAYSFTSGNKQLNGWKWLGAGNNHMGATGVEFWYNHATKNKPMYNCQAMYLGDPNKFGKWVGLPCYTSAPYVCKYSLVPPGTDTPANPAEQMAILEMAREAPMYLSAAVRY